MNELAGAMQFLSARASGDFGITVPKGRSLIYTRQFLLDHCVTALDEPWQFNALSHPNQGTTHQTGIRA
jgi:hypothetical protein